MELNTVKFAYDVIKENLMFRREEKDLHPPKISLPLNFTSEGVLSTFCNIMGACLHNGYYGSKTIMCDMPNGKTRSRTILFDPNDEIVNIYDSGDWTAIRCALMAIIAIEKYFEGQDLSNYRVGYIGAGKINEYTATLMSLIHRNSNSMVAGNPNKDPKTRAFSFGTPGAWTAEDLGKKCDIVISATNSVLESDTLNVDLFEKTKLFISQDTGYIFDQSFRSEIPSFTDDVSALTSHYEDEFPHDVMVGSEQEFRPFEELSNKWQEKAAVYLYGIALTDIALAYAYHHTAELGANA